MSESGVWWRTTWMEAVWRSDLRPLDKLTAAVYADHARDKRSIFVTLNRLCQRAGLSRDAAHRAVHHLVDEGWLVPVGTPKPRQRVYYSLVLPESASTPDGLVTSTADVPDAKSTSTPGDITSTADDITSTPGVPDQRSYPRSTSVSLSPDQRSAQKVLGCSDDDERLMVIPSLIRTHGVRSAPAWLRSCEAKGDLDELIEAEMQKLSDDTDPWISKPRSSSWPEGWGPEPKPTRCTYSGCDQGLIYDEATNTSRRCPSCRPRSTS